MRSHQLGAGCLPPSETRHIRLCSIWPDRHDETSYKYPRYTYLVLRTAVQELLPRCCLKRSRYRVSTLSRLKSMAFGNGCEPYVDWSLCEEDTGYPSALPLVYVLSAALYASTGVLYVVSGARTARTQLREKKKLSFNTAMQMHVGVVTFSAAGFTHAVVSKPVRAEHACIGEMNSCFRSTSERFDPTNCR